MVVGIGFPGFQGAGMACGGVGTSAGFQGTDLAFGGGGGFCQRCRTVYGDKEGGGYSWGYSGQTQAG